MKRNSRRLSGWIVVAVIALSVGMIGASEQLPPEGPLASLYAQIHALFVETGLLAAESDDQQEQIDQLTGTGGNLTAVSQRAGHSRTSMTADVYAHAVEGMQKELATRLERLFG